ncbi:WD40 repeat domain-containing serine/threonine protein kinase [Singulisphaera sp. PoT]|uniref:WD40 repeat domain-containing serine/threonine protein kinase n=1 Tax=Singulisphaera sp. PoT TaxID=3411797 RepID=UPI003BF5FC0A
MSPTESAIQDPATPSAIRSLESACDRFEAAWGDGLRPLLEDHLGPPGSPGYAALLRELLVLELAYRQRAGEQPNREEYQDRFSRSEKAIAAAFDAIEGSAGGDNQGSPDDQPGSLPTIPGYTLLEELGRGGMGVVYKARPERLSRLVALKMILAGEFAGAEAAARFYAEAEAVARLQHPQVVQIFRIGDYKGHPYLEMEFVEGGSLADRLDGTPWRPKEAARLVESLALAVHHAHRRRIIHRDLKPANILLTTDATPKLTDFGLAKSLGTDEGLTRTDSIIGSPSYMAPEQTGGNAQEVGPATDVYALGAILYELLTGCPPFRAATVLETLELVKTTEPASFSRIQPGLPMDIETIALKCLQKEPARRYASAEALAADLRRFIAGEPVLARPIGSVERWFKWARRRPLTAGLAVFSAISTVLLIVVLAITNVMIRQALNSERRVREELARTNAQLAEQQKRTEKALENKTVALELRDYDLQRERQASYYRRIELAEAERRAGRISRAEQILDECPTDLRGWEWRYLKKLPPATPTAFFGHTGEVWDAAISPDGKTLATAGFDLTVRVWDVATARLKQTLEGHKARVYSVAFNKAGDRLVSASADRSAIVWDVTTGERIHVLRGHTDNVRCAAFSPDDAWIVSGSWDGTLRVWQANSGRPAGAIETGAGWITRLSFSPDGLWVAVGGTSGQAEVWEYLSGRQIQTFHGKSGPVLSVAFSPDGWRIATTSNSAGIGVIRVWDIPSGRETLTFRDGAAPFERVTFSPDGRRLATSGWDGNVKLWDILTGREILCLRGHSDRVWGIAFSPNGDSIVSASADRSVLLWDGGLPPNASPAE